MKLQKTGRIITGIFIGILFSGISAWADPLDFNNAVGLFVMVDNATNVYGLQYQRWYDRAGFQVEGAAYYDPSSGATKTLDYNINVEFQYKLYDTSWGTRAGSCLYAWILAGHRGFIENTWLWNDETGDSEKTDSHFYADAVAGIGFGFDIMFLNHLSAPVQFGFIGQFPNEPAFGITFGTGLRYRF